MTLVLRRCSDWISLIWRMISLVISGFSSHSNLVDDNSVELSQNNAAPAEEGSATHISNGEDEEIIEYFNGDPLLPIYERRQKPLATKVVAAGIENGINNSLIAKLIPHQPAENMPFMIGTNFLGHWKDILSDNFGVWKASGTKHFNYSTTFDRNKRIILKPGLHQVLWVNVTSRAWGAFQYADAIPAVYVGGGEEGLLCLRNSYLMYSYYLLLRVQIKTGP